MDAVNLNPTPPTGSAANAQDARSRAAIHTLDSKVAAAPAAADAQSARPTQGLSSTGDRIERSPAMKEHVAALKQQLGRLPPPSQDELAEVQRRTNEALHASHDVLVRAAIAILRGELYFVASP